MPLYAGIGGAQKEIGALYAGVGGAAKQIDSLYAGVGGSAKDLFSSGYRWRKYNLTSYFTLQYEKTGKAAEPVDASGRVIYYRPADYEFSCNISNNTTQHDFKKNPSGYTYSWKFYEGNSSQFDSDGTLNGCGAGCYLPVMAGSDTLADVGNCPTQKVSRVLKWDGTSYGEFDSSGANGANGDFYTLIPTEKQGDTYLETVTSDNLSAFPVNGAQDGYWYVYDGEITWAKHSVNQISEPSTFGSSSSFSNPSTSSPYLMASQAKKDSNGNVDWGTTYTATSSTTLRNNYTKYPYCSMASTLDADNLYKITSASTLSRQRQQVTGWAVTSESAGDYIGDVTGKYGDYPENGAQDGFWYIQQEIT